MTKPTKAIIYARFSPTGRTNCESIETQVEACKRHAQAKGYVIEGEFSDAEKSGDDPMRPGLLAAFEALTRGSVLIVHHLDRLARKLADQETFYKDVRDKYHAKIEVVEGGIDGEDRYRVLLRQVMGAFAEFDRKEKAARTKMAMLRHQASGRRMSAEPPYGKSRFDDGEKKRLIDNPEEQDIIANILLEHEAGQGARQICRDLESRGVLCRGRQRWYHQTIKTIIHRAKTEE